MQVTFSPHLHLSVLPFPRFMSPHLLLHLTTERWCLKRHWMNFVTFISPQWFYKNTTTTENTESSPRRVFLLVTVTCPLLPDPWGRRSIVWTLSGQGSPQGSPEVKTYIIDLTSGQPLWRSPEGRTQVGFYTHAEVSLTGLMCYRVNMGYKVWLDRHRWRD